MVRHKSRSRSRSRDRKHRDRERSRSRERKKDKEKEKDRRRHGKSSSVSKRSRSRSRSPRASSSRKDKSRRDRDHRSSASSSPSPDRFGSSSLTLGNLKSKSGAAKKSSTLGDTDTKTPIILDPKELEGKSVEEIEMLKLMGFSNFDSTKGKHVDGACNAFAINIQQKRKYRQYMNRKGGFNKPLDPVA